MKNQYPQPVEAPLVVANQKHPKKWK